MFPLKVIFQSFFSFLVIYSLLTFLSALPPARNFLGWAFGEGCQQLGEAAFPGMTFRVKPDNDVSGRLEYGIRLLYFSDAEIERAREAARARGDSRVAMAPPSAVRLELYISVLVPLFFLWSLVLATPAQTRSKVLQIIAATILFFGYLSFRLLVIMRAAIGTAGLDAYTPSPTTLAFYTTLADMLAMGVNMVIGVLIWGLLLVVAKHR